MSLVALTSLCLHACLFFAFRGVWLFICFYCGMYVFLVCRGLRWFVFACLLVCVGLFCVVLFCLFVWLVGWLFVCECLLVCLSVVRVCFALLLFLKQMEFHLLCVFFCFDVRVFAWSFFV